MLILILMVEIRGFVQNDPHGEFATSFVELGFVDSRFQGIEDSSLQGIGSYVLAQVSLTIPEPHAPYPAGQCSFEDEVTHRVLIAQLPCSRRTAPSNSVVHTYEAIIKGWHTELQASHESACQRLSRQGSQSRTLASYGSPCRQGRRGRGRQIAVSAE